MNANSFAGHIDELIEVYLADGLSNEERTEFEAHCAGCDPCRKSLAETKEFEERALQALTPDRAPTDLAQRVITAFRRNQQSRGFRGFFQTKLYRVARVVAAALLLIVIGMRVTNPPKNDKIYNIDDKAYAVDNFVQPTVDAPYVYKSAEVNTFNEDKLAGAGLTDKLPGGNADTNKLHLTYGEDSRISWDTTKRIESNTTLLLPEKMDDMKHSLTSLIESQVNPQIQPGSGQAEKLLAPDRKIIKSGALTFEVESFETAYQQVVAILTEEKGYVASSTTTKLPNGKVRGEITIRILPEKFDTVTLKLRALGELKNQQVTSEDVTKQYVDIMARLKNSQALEERLLKLMAEKKGEVKDFLEIEKELANVREKVEQSQGELKYYDNLAALATVKLDIYEKDLAQPVEYVQTQSANLTVAVAEVETAYQAAQKIVHDLKGQIADAQLNSQDKRSSATLQAYVDADQFASLMNQLKVLGEVKSAAEGQRQTAPAGATATQANMPVRRERGLVSLTLNPPAGEYLQTQEAQVMLEAADVDSIYNRVQALAQESGAKVLNGNIVRGTDQTTAVLFCEVAADRFALLVNNLKSLGRVKSSNTAAHQVAQGIDPKSNLPVPVRAEPGRIQLTITTPAPIVAEASGVNTTVKNSLSGLVWSLHMLVVGFLTVAPWLAAIILIAWLIRRRYSKKSAKNTPEVSGK